MTAPIISVPSPSPQPAPAPAVWDLAACGAALGITRRTILAWRRLRDPLPGHLVGGRRIIFVPAEVLAWIARQKDDPRLAIPRRKASPRRPKSKAGSAGSSSATK